MSEKPKKGFWGTVRGAIKDAGGAVVGAGEAVVGGVVEIGGATVDAVKNIPGELKEKAINRALAKLPAESVSFENPKIKELFVNGLNVLNGGLGAPQTDAEIVAAYNKLTSGSDVKNVSELGKTELKTLIKALDKGNHLNEDLGDQFKDTIREAVIEAANAANKRTSSLTEGFNQPASGVVEISSVDPATAPTVVGGVPDGQVFNKPGMVV